MDAALKRTPLAAAHDAMGARCVPFAGYALPVQFSSIVDEHRAVRHAAGLFDVSHMGQIFVSGAMAVTLLDRLATNDIAGLAPNHARYTVFCDDRGGILDDLIVYRLDEVQFLVICNASNRAKIVGHLRQHAGSVEPPPTLHDASDERALLALQGPRAHQVLAELDAPRAVLDLKAFQVQRADLTAVSCIVARTGYTGEDGFEISCGGADAISLWQTLIERGEPYGLQPVGLGARDTLRLEARLCLYGQDIDETTNPLEAGLGWVVKLDKASFVGQNALKAIREQGPQRRLVGFEMRGRGIARHGYPIVDGSGTEVGHVTSGAPGLTVGRNIGLGYVPTSFATPGTPIGVRIRNKIVAAEVVKTPFYKRQR